MPVDQGLATLSDRLLFAAVLIYALSMLAYAAAFAFGRRFTAAAHSADGADGAAYAAAAAPDGVTHAAAAQGATREVRSARVLVGAGGPPLPALPESGAIPAPVGPVFGDGSSLAEPPASRTSADRGRGGAGTLGVALTIAGWLLHLGSVLARGFAAHRAPWGNMYEFSSMIALVAVTAFLVLMLRYPVRELGVFVMLPVVAYLGVAGTVLYVPAGPLVPALHSYWIVIHVLAATSATGIFVVSAVANALYLIRDRYDRLVAAGGEPRLTRFAKSLPPAQNLDTLSYRTAAFAFPVWTFAIICGAIWAESAWGRYWGWDPKETWAFITWVVYACYLHARATAGWKGRRAAYLALIGFATFLFDFYGVNMWVNGLHSYAGL
ncbi:MAG TPA: c-type cytochrome biogenesis protein CcsB [Mycobacteriales bacterium]|nr:c-type cytochrome biogenesis protein CcsB [Mycobacteriales bacterium]